nr:hypothetical protein [Streptomyces qinzhouensis]
MVVNILDDARVLDDPEQTVGEVLQDEHEAAALRELAEPLEVLINMLGDAPDATYIASLHWPAVVRAAQTAHKRMRHTDEQRSGIPSRSAQKWPWAPVRLPRHRGQGPTAKHGMPP